MKVIGLTGSISTGKSKVSEMIKELNFNVIDSDELAHDAYENEEIKKK